jgi:hypothetical protein
MSSRRGGDLVVSDSAEPGRATLSGQVKTGETGVMDDAVRRRPARHGHKLGELEANYVDTGTELPSFGRVKVGMPAQRRLVFALFDQAAVGPGYLGVCYDKSK